MRVLLQKLKHLGEGRGVVMLQHVVGDRAGNHVPGDVPGERGTGDEEQEDDGEAAGENHDVTIPTERVEVS